jgi:hypothetical protein
MSFAKNHWTKSAREHASNARIVLVNQHPRTLERSTCESIVWSWLEQGIRRPLGFKQRADSAVYLYSIRSQLAMSTFFGQTVTRPVKPSPIKCGAFVKGFCT